jgi:predicted RNase H-like HicB family nuclease
MKIDRHAVVSRVLIYRDTTQDYIARAIDMDLIGSGDTPNKALIDLKNAIEAQVSFAIQKKAPEIIYFKAEPEYEKRWLEAAKSNIKDLAKGDLAMGIRYIATVIQVEASIPLKPRQFHPITEEALCARA